MIDKKDLEFFPGLFYRYSSLKFVKLVEKFANLSRVFPGAKLLEFSQPERKLKVFNGAVRTLVRIFGNLQAVVNRLGQ